MAETINKLLEKEDLWKRALFTVLFLVINSVLKGVVLITAVVQFLHVLIKQESHPMIAEFSEGLSNYSYAIVRYVTILTDEKPFPFTAWDSSKR